MDVTIANYAPGGVTCAAGCTEAGSYTVCRSAGTAFAVSACQATCTAATMTGYSVGSASGDATIADFAPGAVTRAAGYTRAVSYTVCGSAGTAYSVSACQATCTTATTTAYSDGSASVDVTIADYAPGGVTCAAGYTEAGSHTVFRSAGTAYAVSACQATCTAATMTGYSIGSASGGISAARVRNELGVQAPVGLWDPDGFTAEGSYKNFASNCQTERRPSSVLAIWICYGSRHWVYWR